MSKLTQLYAFMEENFSSSRFDLFFIFFYTYAIFMSVSLVYPQTANWLYSSYC